MTSAQGPRVRRFSLTHPDGRVKTADELQAEATALTASARARADRLASALAANTAEGSSRNAAATVSVTATGALQSLRLTERVRSMTPNQIAEAVLEAYRTAARDAAARTADITQAEVGDSRVTAAVRDLLPAELTALDDEEPAR